MTLRSTIAGRLLAIALGGTIAAATPAPAAAGYLDAGEWLSAATGLGPVMLVPITLHSPVMSDAFGSYTDPTVPILVPDPEYPGVPGAFDWRPRSIFMSGHGISQWGLGPDTVAATFGCYIAVFPCLGVQTFEATFDRPILGFGGLFEWYSGYGEYPPVPLVVNGTDLTAIPALNGSHPHVNGFLGFIGPMDTLRMQWLGGNADNYSWIRWVAPLAIVAVPVPEPSTIILLSAALVGLIASARRRVQPVWARG